MLAKQTAPGALRGEMNVTITLVADGGTDVLTLGASSSPL